MDAAVVADRGELRVDEQLLAAVGVNVDGLDVADVLEGVARGRSHVRGAVLVVCDEAGDTEAGVGLARRGRLAGLQDAGGDRGGAGLGAEDGVGGQVRLCAQVAQAGRGVGGQRGRLLVEDVLLEVAGGGVFAVRLVLEADGGQAQEGDDELLDELGADGVVGRVLAQGADGGVDVAGGDVGPGVLAGALPAVCLDGVDGGEVAGARGGQLAGRVDFVADKLAQVGVELEAALANLARQVGDKLVGALAGQPGPVVLPAARVVDGGVDGRRLEGREGD